MTMTDTGISADILLVEDNPNDVELILHVFQWCNLSNRVHVAWNGEEALDFIFGKGDMKEEISMTGRRSFSSISSSRKLTELKYSGG